MTHDRLTTDDLRLPLDESDAFGFTDAEVAAAASSVERDVVIVPSTDAETDEFERLPTEAEQSVNRPIPISEVRDPDPPRSDTPTTRPRNSVPTMNPRSDSVFGKARRRSLSLLRGSNRLNPRNRRGGAS